MSKDKKHPIYLINLKKRVDVNLMSALFSYRRKIKMNKQKLKEIFEEAKQKTIDVILELTVPTREVSEYIIVLTDNLDYKLDYYMKNYNDNLELERCTDVKILSAKTIDTDLFI